MVHDNSVKRRVLYIVKEVLLRLYVTPVFWKSERAVVEHRTQVTGDHQSILPWLVGGGRAGGVVWWW